MPRFLMCPPDHFGVDYAINPWMADHIGDIDPALASKQWESLVSALTDAGAQIESLRPEPLMPDLVFTSNSGLPRWPFFYPSRFQHPERRPEEAVFGQWFVAHKWCLEPTFAAHEGAGDFLPWHCGKDACLFAGTGFRTEQAAHAEIARATGAEITTLTLIDPRFSHLDTCFRPLPGGRLLWWPCAFDRESREAVESHVPPPLRYAISCSEAVGFAANGIVVGSRYLTSAADEATQAWLASNGLQTVILDVSEFLKAGGGVAALALEL